MLIEEEVTWCPGLIRSSNGEEEEQRLQQKDPHNWSNKVDW